MVAKAAPELIPKRVIDTATASSKKFYTLLAINTYSFQYEFLLKEFKKILAKKVVLNLKKHLF